MSEDQWYSVRWVEASVYFGSSPVGDVGRGDYAIHGKLNSAEVYASHALFGKLWPKLLKASAVEALPQRQESESFSPVSAEAVRDFLADAERGKAYLHTVSERTQQIMQETDKNLLFETRDQHQEKAWIHRSYLTK